MEANRQRDRVLRRNMLRTLHNARIVPMGGLSGTALRREVEAITAASDQFEDEAHVIGLGRDLVNKGLVEETDQRTRKTQRFGLEFLFYRVTAKGSGLVNETLPPDPDVEDERL